MAQPERKDFLGRGWWMPVMLDERTGRVREVEYEEDIRQSIRIIVETAQGERVMRPDFGCGLLHQVFEPGGPDVAAATQYLAHSALERELGEVIVIDGLSVEARDAALVVTVSYVVRRTQAHQVAEFAAPGVAGSAGAS